ncbi:unnamed protein product [Rotaria sordida]|uniref:Uncharacterized protein n=1 Tax=Rotaria sordida TaxID=392033 RepID=A0A815IRV1_9BILA|nr:unnamed protein product [Rotaria sordida]CAF1610837.1 unnamed protein product [Rotaria sordida]
MPLLHIKFEQIKKDKNSIEYQSEESISNTEIYNDQQPQTSNDIISSFKNDLEDIETRLCPGSLGGFIIGTNVSCSGHNYSSQQLSDIISYTSSTDDNENINHNFNWIIIDLGLFIIPTHFTLRHIQDVNDMNSSTTIWIVKNLIENSTVYGQELLYQLHRINIRCSSTTFDHERTISQYVRTHIS